MITINSSEASASLRRIPMWLVSSDGTSAPTTQAAGQPQINWLARGTATVNTAATLSAVSVTGGEYYVELSASEVSCVGIASVQFRAATVPPSSTYFQIVRYDSNNSQDLGLAAFSVVTLAPGTHSNVTIKGIQNYANISSVTLNVGTHSGATIDGVNRINSSVTIANANYSAVTVRPDIQSYSGLTVGVNNIAAGNYSGATVEVSNIARASMQSMADSFLRRGLALGTDVGRNVQDALRSLRNRVAIGGSTLTVYTEDDVTSAWTAGVTSSSTANPITGIDPGGP